MLSMLTVSFCGIEADKISLSMFRLAVIHPFPIFAVPSSELQAENSTKFNPKKSLTYFICNELYLMRLSIVDGESLLREI